MGTEYLQIGIYARGFSVEDYPQFFILILGRKHWVIGVVQYGNTFVKEKRWEVVPMLNLIFCFD